MKPGPPGSSGARLKAFREAAGYTQEELATIAGLSVHGVSALERGHPRATQPRMSSPECRCRFPSSVVIGRETDLQT